MSGPLPGLLATLLAWLGAGWISRRLGHPSWAAPPVVAIVGLIVVLRALRIPYPDYMAGARFVDVLLGPATVALAVPIYASWPLLRRRAGAAVPALLAGSAVTAGSAMLIARALGAPGVVVRSIGVKSVTVPIAMGISARVGGEPALTAAFVMMTALITVPAMMPVFRLLRVQDRAAQGVAAGTVAHGIATARMLMMSDTAGAFAGLAIGLNAVVSAMLVPPLVQWLAPVVR